jgi:hypothetical protein
VTYDEAVAEVAAAQTGSELSSLWIAFRRSEPQFSGTEYAALLVLVQARMGELRNADPWASTKEAPPDHREEPRAKSRLTDPETSAEAAASLSSKVLGELHERILGVLTATPSTTSEIAARLEMPRDSISPRMKELTKLSRVRPTGSHRPGPSGRRQRIWMAL